MRVRFPPRAPERHNDKSLASLRGFFVWRRDPESNRTDRICNPGHNRFAIAPLFESTDEPSRITRILDKKKGSTGLPCSFEFGAGEESRTLDLNLGKVALYQLSYSRMFRRYFVTNVSSAEPAL